MEYEEYVKCIEVLRNEPFFLFKKEDTARKLKCLETLKKSGKPQNIWLLIELLKNDNLVLRDGAAETIVLLFETPTEAEGDCPTSCPSRYSRRSYRPLSHGTCLPTFKHLSSVEETSTLTLTSSGLPARGETVIFSIFGCTRFSSEREGRLGSFSPLSMRASNRGS